MTHRTLTPPSPRCGVDSRRGADEARNDHDATRRVNVGEARTHRSALRADEEAALADLAHEQHAVARPGGHPSVISTHTSFVNSSRTGSTDI